MITVNDLFKTQSIANIKLIVKKTNEDRLEKEKQLKTLIGQKYEEILQLSEDALKLKELLTKLSEESLELSKINITNTFEKKENPQKYINKKLKFIKDAESRLITLLSNFYYLDGAFIYQKTLKFYSEIPNSDSNYPSLKDLIQSISETKDILLNRCKKNLESQNILKDEDCAQVLCCIYLLNSSMSLKSLLDYFLERRSVSIETSTNTSDLFHSYQSSILFSYMIIKKLMVKISENHVIDPVFELLFSLKDLRDDCFVPLRERFEKEENIEQSSLKNWIEKSLQTLVKKIEVFIENVKSAKEFVEIEEITMKQTKFYELEYSYISYNFSEIFSKEDIFEKIFSKIFQEKKKIYIEKEFSKIKFELPELKEEGNLGNTLWETPILTLEQIHTRYKLKSSLDTSNPYSIYNKGEFQDTLSINVSILAPTPQVGKIMNDLYLQLKEILENLSALIVKERLSKNGYAEKHIYECIQKLIDSICNEIEKRIENCKKEEKIYYSRLYSLKKLFIDILAELNYGIKKRYEFLNRFDVFYKKSFEEWINKTSENFSSMIKESLEKDDYILIHEKIEEWDDIEIVLDSEKELIKIPSKPSPYIEKTLFETSTELYNLCGYQIEPFISTNLSYNLCEKVYLVYSSFVNTLKVKEEVYLQLLFDILYLGDILLAKKEKFYHEMVSFIIEKIDPINYQIYEKPIYSNVTIYVKNTFLLFTFSQYKLKSKNDDAISKGSIKFAPIVPPFQLLSIPMERKDFIQMGSPRQNNNTNIKEEEKESGVFGSFFGSFFKK